MWIPLYQLTSDHPRKLPADDEFCGDKAPVTFHLMVMNDRAKKRAPDKLLDKRISVVLDGFFCSETAWHGCRLIRLASAEVIISASAFAAAAL
jgi:thymidylate kinase